MARILGFLEKLERVYASNMPRSLQVIADELNHANQSLVDAMDAGDLETAGRLADETARLQRERDKALAAARFAASAGYTTAIPVRDRTIQVLDLVGTVTPARLISDLSFAIFNETIASTALSSLRRDEQRSWGLAQDPASRTSLRDVYVVPALSHDRLAPVRGSWTLSSWSAERRIVAPLSPRVDLLRARLALADAAEHDGEQSKTDRVLARLAGQNPFEPIDVDAIRASAIAELASIEDADTLDRSEAARRCAAMDAESRLFGSQLRAVQTRSAAGARRLKGSS